MYAAGFDHLYQELREGCKTVCLLHCKINFERIQNKLSALSVDISKVFTCNVTIFINKLAYCNDSLLQRKLKKILYSIISQYNIMIERGLSGHF